MFSHGNFTMVPILAKAIFRKHYDNFEPWRITTISLTQSGGLFLEKDTVLKKIIRIAIVDDNAIMRQALPSALLGEEDLKVTATSGDAFEAIELARNREVDILLLEPMMPGKEGIDLIKDIATLNRDIKVMVLTRDDTPSRAFRILRAGAMGWMSKRTDLEQLIQAIRTVHSGRVFLPRALQTIFAEKYVHPEAVGHPEDQLSDREYQVMTLLASGHTNREIAEILFIGVKTVDTHRANLIRKLGLRNNADVTRYAIRHGVIKA